MNKYKVTVEIEIHAVSVEDALVQLDYQMESNHTQTYASGLTEITGSCPVVDYNVISGPKESE